MAASKLLIASLLISLFFLQLVLEADAGQVVNSYTPSEPMPYEQKEVNSGTPSEPMPAGTPSEPMPAGKIDCASASCARCSRVPRGTSGNQDVCPCHASLATHGGRKECP